MAQVFINEFRFRDLDADDQEFIEIAGPAGTDLTNWRLALYNGETGRRYEAIQLSGTIDDEGNGTGAISFALPAMTLQNGDNTNGTGDGIALIDDQNTLVQFISYRGNTFQAANGIAQGVTSVDVGTHNGNSSLQLTGTGDQSGDFSWGQSTTISSGSINTGQTLECFLAGTRILTDNGEIAVEDLQVGDKVKTATDNFEPVKWIGRQTVEPRNVKTPLRGYPILITAGALGAQSPRRDLYISPDHALLVDGLLINAGALVNDISILKTTPTEAFTYYHVELEQHALLVVEGTHAESYLPQKEDRSIYDNGEEYETLYPAGSKIVLWPLDYPRVSSTATVPRYVRKRLMAIAHQLYGETAGQMSRSA